MRLRRLEIQGFKTFAQKTAVEFVDDRGGMPGLTAIVGPNGSGKSNIADAIRWVIGEQSMRLLRAKKSEDLIFSGTVKKARAGFAEVTMTVENETAEGDELREIVVTRRVYRDGKSEYEVNKKPARLSDVTLLLAQAGLGQRTYSVIGQGMADRILSASPAERKEFFDEAAGLRPYQLKRTAAEQKLDASQEKLLHADLVLRELAPHVSSLERQAKRLEERGVLQQELERLERQYYGMQWKRIRGDEAALAVKKAEAENAAAKAAEAYAAREVELERLEAASVNEMAEVDDGELKALREKRASVREERVRLEARVEAMTARPAEWSPLPLSDIVGRLSDIRSLITELVDALSPDGDAAAALALATRIGAAHDTLAAALQKPVPTRIEADPKLTAEIAALTESLRGIEAAIHKEETRIAAEKQKEGKERSRLFKIQHELQTERNLQSKAEQDANRIAVELARVETKREALLEDLRTHAPGREAELEALAETAEDGGDVHELSRQLSKVRSRVEWIGGIDPSVLDEYAETKKRFDGMREQAADLKEAILSLQTVIAELDETIKKRAELSFRVLNKEFGVYFKKLFGGGEAALVEIRAEPVMDEEGNVVKEAPSGPAGFDITANPPGKRMKSIALLSGGERALTSIALLCAIMATNPSPFVVLDEVDAALDESNSEKFGAILHDFASRTQFVVITHNRATMNHAHVLYGVTMGDDGVSRLLSVKLEDVLKK